MHRELWPLFALPFAIAALGASLFLATTPGRGAVATAAAPSALSAGDWRPAGGWRPHVPPAQSRSSLIATVRPGNAAVLHARPGGGGVAGIVGARTEFGSPRVLSVVRRRGHWLGVASPTLPNGELGWVDSRRAPLRLGSTDLRLEADLSSRRLTLFSDGLVVRRLRVGIGRPGSTTPVGRFAVTDKLSGPRYSGAYGCCILALSGRQPNLPPGWSGGNRLAIHGTSDPRTIGRAASAGCLHAGERDLRTLMQIVPLGTPVVIQA